MVTEILKQFVVKNYKEAFKLYKKGEFGCIEQRMPENLKKMPKSEGTDLERILSLLEADEDNIYSVVELGNVFIITILGFRIHKTLEENVEVYYLQFGEDGKWEEVAYKGDVENYQDGTRGELSMGADVKLKHVKIEQGKNILKPLFSEFTAYIDGGDKLGILKDVFFKMGASTLWRYLQEDHKDDKEVNSGFLHYENGFYLSKNSQNKPQLSLKEVGQKITNVLEDGIKQSEKPSTEMGAVRVKLAELRERMEFWNLFMKGDEVGNAFKSLEKEFNKLNK
jgi:hypothetical protein